VGKDQVLVMADPVSGVVDSECVRHYLTDVIRSFRSKALKRYAEAGDRSKLSVQNLRRLDRILERLETAVVAEDMNLAGWRFHALKGRSAGRYAVDASGNWRITFGWDGADAVDVDLEDYH
jgi:proteic killer suppression protein